MGAVTLLLLSFALITPWQSDVLPQANSLSPNLLTIVAEGSIEQRRSGEISAFVPRGAQPFVANCRKGAIHERQSDFQAGRRIRRHAVGDALCIRMVANITCRGGDVIGSKCICPTGTTLRQRLANNFSCVKLPTVPIVCQGGVVRGGQCSCPAAMDRVRHSANRFRCSCAPGRELVRGQCIRPAG